MSRNHKIEMVLAVAMLSVLAASGNVYGQHTYGQKAGDIDNSISADRKTADSATIDSATATLPSGSTALQYSLLGTLIPVSTLVLAVPGLIVGPAMGYFYGDMPGRAWGGIIIRTVSVGGMVSSFVICGWNCGPGQTAYDIAWAVFISSAAILTGSTIYDIAAVKPKVDRKNEALFSKFSNIVPTYFDDSKAFGLKIKLPL